MTSSGDHGADGPATSGGEGGTEGGYPSVPDRVPPGTQPEAPTPGAGAGGGEETHAVEPEEEGYWVRLGFDSQLAFFDHMERSQSMYSSESGELRNLEREAMGLAPLTEEEIDREIREPRRRQGRQIGIKLSNADYSKLVDAADLFGAAPTTLARLLLNRAVGAVLSSEPAPKQGSRRSGSGT